MQTPNDAAQWMLAKLKADGTLYQDATAEFLQSASIKFADYTDVGQLSINPKVLTEFRKLNPDGVVYDRTERFWRFRDPSDSPGRQQ